jgi:hypothetical protein
MAGDTTWQLLDSVSVQKSIDVKWGARGATAYGNRYVYDQTGPSKTRTFRGELISLAEAETLIAAAEEPFSETASEVTLRVHGVDWTGKVQAVELQRELGLDYYSGTVVLWDATSA